MTTEETREGACSDDAEPENLPDHTHPTAARLGPDEDGLLGSVPAQPHISAIHFTGGVAGPHPSAVHRLRCCPSTHQPGARGSG